MSQHLLIIISAAHKLLQCQTDQFRSWIDTSFEETKSQTERELAEVYLFNVSRPRFQRHDIMVTKLLQPTDPRIEALSPILQGAVFNNLSKVASILKTSHSAIDETFLDQILVLKTSLRPSRGLFSQHVRVEQV